MKDLLGPVRTWIRQIAELPGDFQWLEMDIKEMFPEIPRDDIVPALKHIHDKIMKERKSSSSLYFYLSKDGCRQLDTTVSSPISTHWRFSFSDLAHFVSFDTCMGDLFVFLSSVMTQNTGIPIRGSCSAQLASVVLIFRELRSPLPHILSDAMWIRYRDVHTPDCVPQTKKLMNPTAPTVEYMLQSLIPNWTRNAMHYRLTTQQATTNLANLYRLFSTVGYMPSQWRPMLRKQALKWGAVLPSAMQ